MKKLALLLLVCIFIGACQKDKQQPYPFDLMNDFYPQNPSGYPSIYTLYHILVGSGLRMGNLDSEYQSMLRRSYGISQEELKEVLGLLANYSNTKQIQDNVLNRLNEDLSEALMRPKNFQGKELIERVLPIFLTLKLERIPVSAYIEGEILKLFKESVAHNSADNPLFNLLMAIDTYQKGGMYHNMYLEKLNNVLEDQGYILSLSIDSKLSVLFKIKETLFESIPWDDESTSRIAKAYNVKRFYPQILPSLNGYSVLGENRVVILEDKIKNSSLRLVEEMVDTTITYYNLYPMIKRAKASGVELPLDSFNIIRRNLIKRDFHHISPDSILKLRVQSVGIHEAKHKFDEEVGKLNADSEISAYLTQTALSQCPHSDLMKTISWLEGFRANPYPEKMSTLLNELWGVAVETFGMEDSKEFVQGKAMELYKEYSAIEGGSGLSDISDFKNVIQQAK